MLGIWINLILSSLLYGKNNSTSIFKIGAIDKKHKRRKKQWNIQKTIMHLNLRRRFFNCLAYLIVVPSQTPTRLPL